jgi:hypothetical protein
MILGGKVFRNIIKNNLLELVGLKHLGDKVYMFENFIFDTKYTYVPDVYISKSLEVTLKQFNKLKEGEILRVFETTQEFKGGSEIPNHFVKTWIHTGAWVSKLDKLMLEWDRLVESELNRIEVAKKEEARKIRLKNEAETKSRLSEFEEFIKEV